MVDVLRWRCTCVALVLALLAAPLPAEAQPAGKVHRIGVLTFTTCAAPADDPLAAAARGPDLE